MRTYEPLDARVRELEPDYQSEAEARIGRMLDRYGMVASTPPTDL